MQALVLEDSLSYRIDYPKPRADADEALIRLSLAGICSTDLQLIQGYAHFSGVLGHEFVGVVEAVGQERHRQWLNRRVVGSINIGCQNCRVCREQGPEHCLQRKVLGIRAKDGAFADFLTLPIANLYALPDSVSDEQAVFTEPLAAAFRVVEQLDSLRVRVVAVLGPGRLGLLIAKVLSLAGYQVIVLGRSETSLQLPAEWSLSTSLSKSIPDNHFDCVVDATGQAAGFAEAIRIIRPRGVLILKSTCAAKEPLDMTKVVVGEINVMGSRCGPFSEALRILKRKTVAVETMVNSRYALKDGISAFKHAGQSGVRKILLEP
ncbi:MAG: alcohol dehydrogenase catalytic domain-containing protein [Gammaproteobacteria bacterium]